MRFCVLRLEGVAILRFTGITASALFLAASLGYGAVRGGHLPMIIETLDDWRNAAANSMGFRITGISLAGEKHVSRAEIIAAAGVTGHTSRFPGLPMPRSASCFRTGCKFGCASASRLRSGRTTASSC